MIKVSRLLTSRKAQFFILTAVLVGGSLSITMALLSDYGGINYNEVMSSSSFHQYRSIHRTLDERWFSESWRYRRTVVIFERSGRLMDNYPVHLTINTTRLIRQGKLQPDCSDLRLTEDGEEIPYQIARKSCGRSNTSIWFLTDLESGAVERDVALYYGNPDITRPRYETDLEVNREAGLIETSLLEAAAAPESSRFAFSWLALQTGD
ncbi:MAG: hypothetical protein SVU32_03630, partial [Candidatus Nanohaloarchaea archaeon]|nr:hypothetical protein [Candidatus Nanohaloarchaea archaeon]